MAFIEMKEMAHSYNPNPKSESDYALRKMNLVWENGGAFSLLGPSGCGKSTLLNIISGLVYPSEGAIYFDGKNITRLTTQQRNIAQVFQFPVIYDTMSVFENLAFPLRNRKIPKPEIKKRVQEVAEMLELTSELKKRASGLTADIKQIISLGRGLVRSDVSAILFDEPLTVIDPHIKWILRRRLKQIHETFKLTMIFVTHDQTEALTFADQVVVMNDGCVLQQGTPQELFEVPAHAFIGYFIGSPGMNLMPCKIDGNFAVVSGKPIAISQDIAKKAAKSSGNLKLGIRPEYCEVVSKDTPKAFECFAYRVQNLGDYQLINTKIGDQNIKVKEPIEKKIAADSKIWLLLPEERIHIYENDKKIQ